MNNPEIPDYVKKALLAAYEEALVAFAHDEVPVGAVIVKDQSIIAADHNRIIEKHDPTAHAEMLVIQKAAGILQNERLSGCELFTTLEPCAMCSGAIIMARISSVYFLTLDDKLPGLRSVLSLPGHNHIPSFKCLPDLDVRARELLKNFFKRKRDNKTSSKEFGI